MYHTTGCTDEQIDFICGQIATLIIENEEIEFPESLSLSGSVIVALTYMKTKTLARTADLSRSRLYAQPDIRAEIQRLRDATPTRPLASDPRQPTHLKTPPCYNDWLNAKHQPPTRHHTKQSHFDNNQPPATTQTTIMRPRQRHHPRHDHPPHSHDQPQSSR